MATTGQAQTKIADDVVLVPLYRLQANPGRRVTEYEFAGYTVLKDGKELKPEA